MVIKIFTLEEGCLKRQPSLFMLMPFLILFQKLLAGHKTNVHSNRIFIIS